MKLAVVILAAGKGTRMCSALPKVLHKLAGASLIEHVIQTAQQLNPDSIHVVYGHGGELLPTTLSNHNLNWVLQEQQLGTGHAVEQAIKEIDDQHNVLVLYGDVPLISKETLSRLLEQSNTTESLNILTAHADDPYGYGRIVRNEQQQIIKITEQKDASKEELAINEINTGFLLAPAKNLRSWLNQLDSNNEQGELYLTDVVEQAVADEVPVNSCSSSSIQEVSGVNDRLQLATLERHLQQQIAEKLMRSGVTLHDPGRFDLRGELTAGEDVEIDVNVILEGKVVLGSRVKIAANCILRDVELADGVEVLANSVIEETKIGSDAVIGPFARIRPGTDLAEKSKVGNFVELKKAKVGKGSKINHLSYVGDAELGGDVNIGAGVITCNYDGANKHKTIIEDNVFVGSDTQLIAPITVGAGATIGAGSTVVQDAAGGALTLSRTKQKSIQNWQRPKKK